MALLHLRTPLKLTEYVNLMDLPNSLDIDMANTNCTLLGFGEDQLSALTLQSNAVLYI